MEIKISDTEVRESIPVEITIRNSQGIPKISVDKLGVITPKSSNSKYTATFWAMEEGVYQIVIRDQKEVFKETIVVKKQSYLSFEKEFGFFIFSLFVVLIILWLWMKKLKKIRK